MNEREKIRQAHVFGVRHYLRIFSSLEGVGLGAQWYIHNAKCWAGCITCEHNNPDTNEKLYIMSSPSQGHSEADNLQSERSTLDLGITKITRSPSGEEMHFQLMWLLTPYTHKADETEAGNEDLATLTIEIRRHERRTLKTDGYYVYQQDRGWISERQVHLPNK